MEGSKTGLTRTNSSLLRSSPTIRSSIQSLSSVDELIEDLGDRDDNTSSSDGKNKKLRRTLSSRRPVGPVILTPVLLFVVFLYYSKSQEIPTSENLLLALIFIAITLFLISKNKSFFSNWRNSWDEFAKRVNLRRSDSDSFKKVKWYIGREDEQQHAKQILEEVKEGVEFYTNGDCYEGEFHKGKCNGSGVYNYNVNGRYEGDWIDGKYDGYGIESWARGSKYRGQYKCGMRDGYGVYKFFTGDCYSGEWCNGQSHGIGMQTCSDGSCYVGEFKCGVKHGLGCYHFRNGDRYAGEYFGDKIHGFGVYHFANGHCYEGSWHEGRKQGYDAVLKAVQAARKTAENAIHLRRVDEQVNRAVMAANRAATSARVAAVKAVQNQMDGKFCHTENV